MNKKNAQGTAHAILSASASHRWLLCPPSALLCASLPDIASEFVQQGTNVHELCEYKLKKALGTKIEDPIPYLENLDSEMNNCSDKYV